MIEGEQGIIGSFFQDKFSVNRAAFGFVVPVGLSAVVTAIGAWGFNSMSEVNANLYARMTFVMHQPELLTVEQVAKFYTQLLLPPTLVFSSIIALVQGLSVRRLAKK